MIRKASTGWAALGRVQPDPRTAPQGADRPCRCAAAAPRRGPGRPGRRGTTATASLARHPRRSAADPAAGYGRALRASVVESYALTTKTQSPGAACCHLPDQFGDRTGAGRARLIWAFFDDARRCPARIVDLIDTAESTPCRTWTIMEPGFGSVIADSARPVHRRPAGRRRNGRRRSPTKRWATRGIPGLHSGQPSPPEHRDATGAERLLTAHSPSTRPPGIRNLLRHRELGRPCCLRATREQARRHQETACNSPRLLVYARLRRHCRCSPVGLCRQAAQGDPTTAKASHEHALSVFIELASPTGIARWACRLRLTPKFNYDAPSRHVSINQSA